MTDRKGKRDGRNGVALRKSRLKVVGDKLIIGDRADRSGLTDVRRPTGLRGREKEEKRETVLACIAMLDDSIGAPRGRRRCDWYNFVMRKIQELGRACREVEKPDEPFELYYAFLGLSVIFRTIFERNKSHSYGKGSATCRGARRTFCIAF